MPVMKTSPTGRRLVDEMCHHVHRFLLPGDVLWCSQCGAVMLLATAHPFWKKPHIKAHTNSDIKSWKKVKP